MSSDALGSFSTPAPSAPKPNLQVVERSMNVAQTQHERSTDATQNDAGNGFHIDRSLLDATYVLQTMDLSKGKKRQMNLSLNEEVANDIEHIAQQLSVSKAFLVTIAILTLKQQITT